ncbi:hypothetical protein GCM10011487_18110 [Steroidobacter agaridevorans]|uniref:VOC domain-containing protein n=1 Tax=Steroidobacter agaridevorans TaxID=2695856 RepID=A0A829YA53_9GAMM|nr:VOC family protein [Steroidobacter agaridevorans]GFE79811.1 hypothetical protein GCM10011487_18110 [Steroidobacter agaridevorans]GFE90645.1 hypothetical protein GCM10011488_55990 [Steroidobacter agaridevorans]
MIGALASLENHYQNAYITRDLDVAIEQFRTRHGFDGFQRYEISYELRTRAGLATASIKLALGWIGNLQYELIQPVAGAVDVYTAELPERSTLRFHHVAMRVKDDWNGFRAEVERRKLPVIMEGGAPGQSQWLYIDARDTVGHYLEYCYMTPERWLQLGGRRE